MPVCKQENPEVPTCTFEISTELEPLSDAALWVWGKGLLDILHANSPRTVSAFPEEAVNENLQKPEERKWQSCRDSVSSAIFFFTVTTSDFLLKTHCFLLSLPDKVFKATDLLQVQPLLRTMWKNMSWNFLYYHTGNVHALNSKLLQRIPPKTPQIPKAPLPHTCRKSLIWVLARLEFGPGTS